MAVLLASSHSAIDRSSAAHHINIAKITRMNKIISQISPTYYHAKKKIELTVFTERYRRDSNSQSLPPESNALPLGHGTQPIIFVIL